MITRRRVPLRTIEHTSSLHLHLWAKDPEVFERTARYPLLFAAAEPGIFSRKPGWNYGNGAGFWRLFIGNPFISTVALTDSPRVHARRLGVRKSDEGAGFVHGGTMCRALIRFGRATGYSSRASTAHN